MGAFGWFQLLIDVVFCFLILLLLVGRSWRRGAGAGADQETYREMISTLSALIREMKEGAAEMDRKLEERHAEVERAVAAADNRIQQIEAAMVKAIQPAQPASKAVTVPQAPERRHAEAPAAAARRPAVPAGTESPSGAAPGGESAEMEDDERLEKYRQALDFARKGWTVSEISRHTHLPRGEIDLLIRTKGQGA